MVDASRFVDGCILFWSCGILFFTLHYFIAIQSIAFRFLQQHVEYGCMSGGTAYVLNMILAVLLVSEMVVIFSL